MKLFTFFMVAAVTARLTATESAAEMKNRPVSKVINLLKAMQTQLTKEAEEDEEIYDKLACWCKTNDAEKSKAIEAAEGHIQMLTSDIEEHTANSARLTTEIASLSSEIAHNQESLDKATALRQKQLAEFNAEEKDMLEAITALKSAITVLSKHHSRNDGALVATRVQQVMTQHSALLAQVIRTKKDSKKIMSALLQSSALRGPAHLQAYAPQSGEVFGILGNMKDTFEANLSDSQKEEQANQAAYQDLKAAKEAEIKAGQEQANKKTGELASTDEKNAQAKVDIENTRNSLSADEKFLMDLKEKCSQTDQEWEARQKTRGEEITAVSEALSVLATDDAHDTFTSSFNFIQLSTDIRRSRAAAVLASVAAKHADPALSNLATSVKLDAFTKVKKAIDDMVVALLQEKQDEIKHRDWCINSLHANESQTSQKSRDRGDLEQKMSDLEQTIKTLTSELDALRDEIMEMQKQLKRAGEDREKQNAEFQQTVKEQRETQSLLQRALDSLNIFYAKKKGIALVQPEPAGPPPPAGFKAYKKKNNAGGSSVISLITQIVNDAKAMETEAIRDEEDAQKAYEDFVKDTNSSVEHKQTSIISKSEARATAEGDKTEAGAQHENVVTELEQLANENKDIHTSCDFVLKNFEVRQTARDEEVEALKQAKAILSGMGGKRQE